EKDTLLADDKVSVDIWHWQEDVLQSVQLKQADQDKKRSFQAVYNLKKNQMVQLADSAFIESYRLVKQGDYDFALGFYDNPYRLQNSINYKNTKDIYLTDINTGADIKLFEKVAFGPQLSPQGKYLYWWEPADSSWNCYSIRDKATINLTEDIATGFTNEIHDTPDDPGSYGSMGWTDNDENLFLYDKFDIWKFDPDGKDQPVCITQGYGRENDINLRYVSTDPEEKFLDPEKINLFSLKQVVTKKSGFCRFSIDKPDIKPIMLDDCAYGRTVKAKNADKLLWTRSTVSEFPDLWVGDINFQDGRKISNANPEQSKYVWASVELIEWNDLNGRKHQGLLYKPENLDPLKKYPMIVYFYERHSDGLHTFYGPRASASTVNPLEYASNGYLVFMPDISFQVGFPGKSFYNAIMSGVLELGKRDYVDMKHLGIQGQSWGGYGTAYLITQTGIFAAASPGAPVSNMTSAYGGIRTESGMVRQFQYEKTQSRIGGTLWDKPEYFIENSPLFFADRITTPCLIRHDDADGAVPFSEGVQLFVALRRLNKPAWLINYNGAPHNLSRQADKKDWSVRMMQFFDHYLKDAPAPEWMTQGVHAVDKKSNETYYWKYTEK
ncbi:MAG: prolyl oligopeptidase family serine peptidase, partial [Bacteroidales bacterium]